MLSQEEAQNSKYGFSATTSRDESRVAEPTEYSKSYPSWWLRAAIPSGSNGCNVLGTGMIVLDFHNVFLPNNHDGTSVGIRPVIRVNLSLIKKDIKYYNEWVDSKWYNADGTQTYIGTMQWKQNSTGWWIEDSSGWYPTNTTQKIDGVKYFFKPDGYMASNEYYYGRWYNSDGSCDEATKLTWYQNDNGWWVQDKTEWWPQSRWLKIDGYWYYFNESGYMVTNQYIDGWWIGADGICY